MPTDEELLTMSEEDFKQYTTKKKNRQKELISLKKKIIKEKSKFLKNNKKVARKVLNNIKLQKELTKKRIESYKAALKPLKDENFTTIGQSSGYFRKQPEQKKERYLGFI